MSNNYNYIDNIMLNIILKIGYKFYYQLAIIGLVGLKEK